MATKSFQIEKLRGRDNYDTWKRAAQAYLTINGYWSCTKSEVNESSTEAIKEKHEKALSEIYLMIDPQIYPYLEGVEQVKLAWKTLADAFSDTGACRKVLILQQWASTKLDECASMEEYVNRMTSLWAKVRAVGFKIDEEVAASLMLAGLPSQYQPMIFGLESSKETLSMDYVKNLLLQGAMTTDAKEQASALFTKNKKFGKKHKNKIKCYNCGGPHYARKCNKQKNNNKVHGENASSANLCDSELVLFSACLTDGSIDNDDNDNFLEYDEFASLQNNEVALFDALLSQNSADDWYFDSGATSHMCKNDEHLKNKRESIKKTITVANSEKMNVQCIGDIVRTVETVDDTNKIIIKNVQYVPEICVNLLSVSQMVKSDNKVVFTKKGCTVYNINNKIIATGSLINGLFKLNMISSDAALSVTNDNHNVKLWHRRLGHMAVTNMHFIKNASNLKFNCKICAEGKHSRSSFPVNGSRASDLLELIHTDVCGPMSTASLGGNKYYVSFIDDYSRMTKVYMIKNKSQVFDCFVNYKSLVENQLDRKIKKIRSDNGGEYCNAKFKRLCEESGIIHQKSCPHTPQQNGLAERYNRTIVERARCMLFDSKLSRVFWAEAVLTAVVIMNSTVNSAIKRIPEEVWTGQTVDLSTFRVFGCKAMAKIPDSLRKKFDKKSTECIFVGYAENQKGYRLIERASKKLIICRDVIFFENEFSSVSSSNKMPFLIEITDDDDNDELREEERNDNSSLNTSLEASNNSIDLSAGSTNDLSIQSDLDATVMHDATSELDDTIASTIDDHNADPSFRARVNVNPDERPSTRSIASIFNPFGMLQSNFAFCSVSDALNGSEGENWRMAMRDEMKSMEENRTWDIVALPSGRKALKNKWVLRRKTDENGNLEKYKARLVIKGCSQREGIDYDEVYSPVVRYASIRFLISIAVQFDMEIHQMDAVTAFLQGDLGDEIYMQQPEFFNDGSSKVCLLRKSIYGLKQASRIWNIKFSNVLTTAGYVRSTLDPCVYFKFVGHRKILISIYVDDVLIFSNCTELRSELRNILMTNFKMKDLGLAKYCVGLRITRDRKNNAIYVDQTKYIEELLEKFEMTNCNPMETPSDPNQRLAKEEPNDDFDPTNIPYQQAVGCILYLTQGTRPDIAFAVNNVSRYNNCYTKTHWIAVKRIFRYLKGTKNLRLMFSKNAKDYVFGFCDADWASDVNDRKSCTGYVFLRSGGAISWNSKRQPTVALSTTEAEYMALSSATQESMWLKQFEDEIFGSDKTMNIFCDNQSAISLANNNGYSARCKHIDIRHHYVRQKVCDKKCVIHYVNTDQNAADALTKSLQKRKFQHCRNMFGLI